MTSEPEQSVLRRMVAPPRQMPKKSDGAEDCDAAVRFPRSADELLGLPLEVKTVSQHVRKMREAIADLTEGDLIYHLSAGDLGAGIVVVDAGLLAALIEVQTTGGVSSAPVKTRRPSRTDGVVASDAVDRWLSDLAHSSDGRPTAYKNLKREDRTLDRRAVELTLDPGDYTCLRITMDLAGGAKTGALSLVLPAVAKNRQAVDCPPGGQDDRSNEISSVEVEINVEMMAVEVPLATVLNLTDGTVIPLPQRDHSRATLRGFDRRDLVPVRIGQVEGRWAFRTLNNPLASRQPNTEFEPRQIADEIGLPTGTFMTGVGVKDADAPDLLEDGEEVLSSVPDQSTIAELPELPDLDNPPPLDQEAEPLT